MQTPKIPRKNKREALIDATLEILSVDGMAGISAALVAKRAGVSKANLFHHFSGIDELILESFEKFARSMLGGPTEPDISFAEWLAAISDVAFTPDTQTARLMRVYLSFSMDAFGNERIRLRMLELIKISQADLAKSLMSVKEINLSQEEAREIVGLIIVTLDGFFLHMQLTPERGAELQKSWAIFVEILTKRVMQT